MNVNRAEVVTRFCKLADLVGSHFKNAHACDCFCDPSTPLDKQDMNYRFEPEIVAFIEAAVTVAIQKANAARGET
jgi:hypothetical protein